MWGRGGERRKKGERKRESEGEGREGERKAADGKEQIIWQSSAPSTQELLDLLETHLITMLAIVIHYWLRRGRREERTDFCIQSSSNSPITHSIKEQPGRSDSFCITVVRILRWPSQFPPPGIHTLYKALPLSVGSTVNMMDSRD